MLINAAVTAATVPYRPLAIQANTMVVSTSGYGIPAGPYHPAFQKGTENNSNKLPLSSFEKAPSQAHGHDKAPVVDLSPPDSDPLDVYRVIE